LTGGGNTNWGSTAAGPDTNALPSGKTNVFFTASAASNYSGTTLDGNFSINSLTFSNSGSMGIAAGSPSTSTLTIVGTSGASAITVNPGAGAATISAPLAIAASQTWANNSSSPLTVSGSVATGGYTLALAGPGATTISGVIGGSGGVVAAGSGLVVLAASNTYTGATAVSGGTLTLSGTGGAVNATSGVTLGQGATLLADNRGGANNTRIPNAAGITLNGGTFAYLGNSTASTSETVGPLTLGPGASTVAISGYGSNSSSTDNATLTFGSGNTFTNSLLRTAMSGSMLDVTTAIPGQGGPGYTGYPNSGGDFVLFGGLSASGGPASINTPADWIVVNGHDIARWSGSHGIHELGIDGQQGGQVQRYYNLGATSNPANANVLINSTSAQTGLTANTTIGSLVVQSATVQTSTLTGYALNIENNGSGSSNPVDNNGGIIVSGSADFTPDGGYTINGGTITSGLSGKSSELFTWIDSGTTTINSVIADIGGGATTLLAKAGSGTLVLGGANTYSAGTALDQGILRFASGTLPHAAASIHFDGGTLQWATGNSQDISAGIAPIGSGETAILDTNGNNVNFATGLSGGGGLAKAGSGTLSLLGVNTYSGATTISAGVLQAGASNALSASSAVTINGGALDATAFAQTVQSLTVRSSGALDLSLGNLLTSTNYGSLAGAFDLFGTTGGSVELISFPAQFSGSFSTANGIPSGYLLQYEPTQLDLVPVGPATWVAASGNWGVGANWNTGTAPNAAGETAIFSASNSTAAIVTLDRPITVGTLQFGNGGSSIVGYAISGSNALTLDNSGSASVIAVNDHGSGTYLISAPVVLNGNLDVSPSAGSTLTISGNVSQSTMSSLTLDAPGTLILSGTNNTYSGDTLVTAGTLIVSNSGALLAGSSLTVGDAGAFPAAAAPTVAVAAAASPGATAAVPEPGTLALLSVAGIVAAAAAWRRSINVKLKTGDLPGCRGSQIAVKRILHPLPATPNAGSCREHPVRHPRFTALGPAAAAGFSWSDD
jgi:autotransporter-associated beta strand protein